MCVTQRHTDAPQDDWSVGVRWLGHTHLRGTQLVIGTQRRCLRDCRLPRTCKRRSRKVWQSSAIRGEVGAHLRRFCRSRCCCLICTREVTLSSGQGSPRRIALGAERLQALTRSLI